MMDEQTKIAETRLLTQSFAATALGFFAGRNIPRADHSGMAMAAALIYYQGVGALEDDPETAIEAAKAFLDCKESRDFMNSIRKYAKEQSANG